jgi:hypothetical protein
LVFDDREIGTVTVAQILMDPDSYVDETMADPLEGVTSGRNKAMLMRGEGGILIIHSFLHGGSVYRLAYDWPTAEKRVTSASPGEALDIAAEIVRQGGLERDEEAKLAKCAGRISGAGTNAAKARLKDEKERQADERRRAGAERRRREADTTGRSSYPVPPKDAEKGPVLTLLDAELAASKDPEPPMRTRESRLVEVVDRALPSLHRLMTETANVGEDDREAAADILPAPAEPHFAQLDIDEVQLLVEKHVRFTAETQYGDRDVALPAEFARPYARWRGSKLPVVDAINTQPIIAPSGQVIAGKGLDRKYLLVHRITPELLETVPHFVGPDDVRRAVEFLLEEWLCDVLCDRATKYAIIALCLTLIERAILPERPGAIITAGRRGGGKTTLINMMAMAVLGRPASAAAWSTDEEERRKAIFAYLRLGPALICWDNIKRGTEIHCPHLEKALTAELYDDRVLGLSETETVPSTTIHFLTGNSIRPRQDSLSRYMVINLNVEHPRPEERPFRHPDVLAWTAQNRSDILRALYTLLLYGIREMPFPIEDEDSESGAAAPIMGKTRFKTWWRLCGYPVEAAARIMGDTFDCGELFRAQEEDAPETTALADVLRTLLAVFGESLSQSERWWTPARRDL